jgi:ferritin-like metal-binding protein YciE
MDTVRELLIDEMQDLYDAEKQLVKALPKLVKAASSAEFSEAVAKHLEETRGHVERLEQAFDLLGEKPKSKPCAAMKGLITETQETMDEKMSEPLLDSALICAAQKVEHYEIAGYGTVKAWAQTLGLDDVVELFDATLEEEKAANDTLTEVAGGVLAEAGASEESASEESEDEVPRKATVGHSAGTGSRRQAR